MAQRGARIKIRDELMYSKVFMEDIITRDGTLENHICHNWPKKRHSSDEELIISVQNAIKMPVYTQEFTYRNYFTS